MLTTPLKNSFRIALAEHPCADIRPKFLNSQPLEEEKKEGKQLFMYSFSVAVLLSSIMWLVFIIGWIGHVSIAKFGIHPQRLDGLPGILLSPFIHEEFIHIFSNTLPFFALTMGLFYFYPLLAWRVLLLTTVISGAFVWAVGDPYSLHFGASGLIYAFAGFLFFSGLFRRNLRLMAISAIVYFLYGSIFWGIIPNDPHVSWQAHLGGLLSGILCAFIFRRHKSGDDDEDDVFKHEAHDPDHHFRIDDFIERKAPEE